MSDTGVLTDIGYLACCRDEGSQADIQAIRGGAIAFLDGVIDYVGTQEKLPEHMRSRPHHTAGGRTVIPGLVDCHTHLAFGGWRADEFRMRNEGKGYLEIAAAGGGIRKTMAQTRAASEEELQAHCETYLNRYIRQGVTAVECKTGYGLSYEDELKVLRVYQKIAQNTPVDIIPTLLAAHIVPGTDKKDAKCNKESYILMICEELLPEVARLKLAEFNDIFVEEGAFSVDDARRVLGKGAELGLRPKLHVDQLGDSGGGLLAAEVHAISADHLEYTSREGMQSMAREGVTAVCLPFASLYLGQPAMKARAFMAAGVSVAVATDFNPGSAPCQDLPLAMMLACTTSRMTPTEALKGATLFAARAVGREHLYGSLEVGKRANFAELDIVDVEHWLYHFNSDRCTATWIGGQRIYTCS